MPNETLTIIDHRTEQTYSIPVSHGTIRAMDLRQIMTGPGDFGLMTYDPAFMNTASCQSAITYLDGDKGFFGIAAIRLSNWRSTAPFWRWLICCCTANCRPRRSWSIGTVK
jgi:hypothetical protein